MFTPPNPPPKQLSIDSIPPNFNFLDITLVEANMLKYMYMYMISLTDISSKRCPPIILAYLVYFNEKYRDYSEESKDH